VVGDDAAGVSAAQVASKKKLKAVRPKIKGKAVAGSRLTVTTGKWGPGKVTLKIQWLRNGKAIKKATKKNYTLVGADVGKKVSVKVTGSKKGFAKRSKTSKAVSVKPKAGAPTSPPTKLPPAVVWFPDPDLRACVNHKLGQAPDAAILADQAVGITGLDCSDRAIVSLADIGLLTGLKSLVASNNKIATLVGIVTGRVV